MKKNLLRFLFFLLLSLTWFFSCGNNSTEVQISAPLRPKFAAKGYKKIYIADFFVSGQHDVDKEVNINVNKEIIETLKSEFKDKSGYEVASLHLEADKNKKPEDILSDTSFWLNQNIDDRQGSLILAGAAEFSNHEKSGLVTERVTNPRTGLQRDVTNSRERLQLVLAINVYLIDAPSGQKLFNETFREEQVYDDVSNVSLPLFYDVFEKIAPKIVGVLVPYRVAGSRILMEP
jgi:hypothetical protein